MGSLALTAVVAVLAFPIGIGAAVYLEEYARDNRFTRFINTNIRNLAGVPFDRLRDPGLHHLRALRERRREPGAAWRART